MSVASGVRLRAPSATKLELAAVTLLYLVTAVVITWPLAAHLSDSIYLSPGRPWGDQTGIIGQLRELAQGPEFPFAPGVLEDFNAPDGQPIQWTLNIAMLPRTLLLWVMAIVFGANAALGLFVLGGYVASGVAMFLLVRRQTGHAALAAILGWAFAFYPFAVANGEHADFIHGWPFVLLLWRWLVLVEAPTPRNGVFAGLAAVLAISFSAYYVLLGGVLMGTLLVIGLVHAVVKRDLRRQLGAHALYGGLVFFWVASVALLSVADPSASGLRPNYMTDVVGNSARPLNYVLPPGSNPVTGGLSSDALEARGWLLNTEKTLYLGWSLILLAVVGIATLARRADRARHGFLLVAAGVVLLVAGICSGPPQVKVFGQLINMPPHYIFEITSAWRIFSRFVIIVELALIVLAAAGAMALLRGRGQQARAAILVGLAVIIPLDLWSQFSPRVDRIETPKIYSVLREQPPGLVAQHPLRPTELAGDYRDLYFQDAHGKPMVNGYPPRTDAEARAVSLSRVDDPAAVVRLADAGIDYALVEKVPLPGVDPPGTPPPGIEVIAEDDFATLYRVPKVSLITGAAPVRGFSVREVGPTGGFRWMVDERATLQIKATCGPCRAMVTVRMSSFTRSRRAQVSVGGRVVARRKVTTKGAELRFPVRFRAGRIARIVVSARPGPQSIKQALGSTDTRSVSVAVGPIRIETPGQRVQLTTW